MSAEEDFSLDSQEEGSEEEDVYSESDLQEEGSYQSGSDQPNFEEENQEEEEEPAEAIEVTPEMIAHLKGGIASNDLTSARKVINIFTNIFNEKKLAKGVTYSISKSSILQELVRLFLYEVPRILIPLIKVKKREGLIMVFAKNVLIYLRGLMNPAMEAFTVSSLSVSRPIFISKPSLNSALLKIVAEKWAESDSLSVQLNCFLLLKETIPGGGELAKKLLNFMLRAFFRKSNNLRWDNYDLFIFKRNCFRELASLEPSISYVVFFDKLREIGNLIVKCSNSKTEENVKKIYNSRYIQMISLFVDLAIDFAKHPFLRELNYPIVETLLAYVDLYQKTEYYPLILHVYDNLTRYMEHTSVRFSVSLGVLKLLKTKFLRSKLQRKPTTFDFDLKGKCAPDDLQSEQHWREFMTKALWILKRNLVVNRKQRYFESYCAMILRFLKDLSKSKMTVEKKRVFIRLYRQTVAEIKAKNEAAGKKAQKFESQLLEDLTEENKRREQAIKLKISSAVANVKEKELKSNQGL